MRSVRRSIVALGIALGACTGPTEPPETAIWRADFADGGVVGGGVAMVAGVRDTQIGVSVLGWPAGARLGWAVRNGTCTGSGSLIGPGSTFAPIPIGDEGDGELTIVLHRRVDTDTEYVTELFEAEDRSGQPLTCAPLVREQ